MYFYNLNKYYFNKLAYIIYKWYIVYESTIDVIVGNIIFIDILENTNEKSSIFVLLSVVVAKSITLRKH